MHRGLREVRNARVLYVDMNAFFASCEQQRHPEWRGKPVAVASHTTDRGSVLACSYEAKKFGISTGMRNAEAKQRCPGLIITETDGTYYKDIHLVLMKELRELCGSEEVCIRSIDEAAIYLPRNFQSSEQAHELALLIKQRLAALVGETIRCSIGIAPNSLLAKVATNLQKPNGLIEISVENLVQTLEKLSLTDLPGIASKNEARLAAHGIATPLQLYATPQEQLGRWFGVWGLHWWWRLHGFEVDEHWGANPMKSMSHEHVLTKWYTKRSEVEPTLHKMIDRLVYRLRKNGFACSGIGVSIRLSGGGGYHGEHVLDQASGESSLLVHIAQQLITAFPEQPARPYRKAAIYCWGLQALELGQQLDLFEAVDRGELLSKSIEKVRTLHGFQSIQLASSMLAPASAKQQIGFGRVRDVA